MPYIIDGNNLIGSCPDISREDPLARSKIVAFLKKYQERKRNNVIVVFDGAPENGVRREDISSKFSIFYPHEGSTADDEIIDILDRFNCSKDVTVVTSDRELKTLVKNKGAKAVNSIEFYFELKRISRSSGKEEEFKKRIETELSDGEVDHWLKVFDQ
jgi:predicted RNA-binding protein with PIN domain